VQSRLSQNLGSGLWARDTNGRRRRTRPHAPHGLEGPLHAAWRRTGLTCHLHNLCPKAPGLGRATEYCLPNVRGQPTGGTGMGSITPHYRTVRELLQARSFSIDDYQREYSGTARTSRSSFTISRRSSSPPITTGTPRRPQLSTRTISSARSSSQGGTGRTILSMANSVSHH
jgi:hypothetical protein